MNMRQNKILYIYIYIYIYAFEINIISILLFIYLFIRSLIIIGGYIFILKINLF